MSRSKKVFFSAIGYESLKNDKKIENHILEYLIWS